MDRYDVMNEEKSQDPDNSNISSVDYIVDRVRGNVMITLYLKVTDSDIRAVEVNPEIETVASLKSKVRKRQGFWKELTDNQKVRLIFNGRIMLDNQNLSIYSKDKQNSLIRLLFMQLSLMLFLRNRKIRKKKLLEDLISWSLLGLMWMMCIILGFIFMPCAYILDLIRMMRMRSLNWRKTGLMANFLRLTRICMIDVKFFWIL
jgi:hypothetical protein